MAMLHSFWQAALLLLLYVFVNKIIHKNNAPLAKRNILYATLFAQLILFVFTFTVYFFDTISPGNFTVVTDNIETYIGSENIRSLTQWIFGIYIFVIAYKLIHAVYNWYHFKLQYKSGLCKPAVELKLFTELKVYEFGIKKKVKLWLSNTVQTPVTFGFFKPVILLPVALVNNITVQQAETLILHELTHIRTNDYLLNWFLIAAESLFFFNPFIIHLCKNIRQEREKNCDINVLSFQYAPALYAETLLQAERMKQLVPGFQLAAVNQKKYLLQRIQYFTNEKIIDKTLQFNIVAPLIGLVLLLMLSATVLFQSGKSTSLPSHSTSDIQYLPFNNYIISDAEFGKDIIPAEKGTKILTEQPEQQPLIENNIHLKQEPVSKPEQHIIEDIVKPVNANFALPVTKTENDAARQIIVKEEGSGSASVKIYYLSFEDGKWILQPEWIITAKEIITDSLIKKIDSVKTNIRRYYPAQQ